MRGEIVPHEAGTVTLHAVANPFAISGMAGPDGSFRFWLYILATTRLTLLTRRRRELRNFKKQA